MKQFLKTKMTSMAIVLSLLTGGVTVLADEVPSDALAIYTGANITVQTGDDNLGQYLAFTPSTTGYYRFWSDTSGYSGNETNDTYVYLYDSDMNEIGHQDDGNFVNYNFRLNCLLSADETYYLFATTYGYADRGMSLPSRFDVHLGAGCGGTVEGADYEYRFGNSADVIVDLTGNSECSLIADAPSVEGVTYEYIWFFCYRNNTVRLDESSNTLTPFLRDGYYECYIRGSDNSRSKVTFDVNFDQDLRWADNMYSGYMLVAPDTSFVLSPDYTIFDDSVAVNSFASPAVFAANSDRSRDWEDGGILIFNEQDTGVTVSDGVSDFAVIDYGIETEFEFEDDINRYEHIFVLGDETDGTLESGVPFHVDVKNELSGEGSFLGDSDYTFQQIYSFTAESDGTALIEVSDIRTGVPCVAVFDEDCNFIDSMGGTEYFLYEDGILVGRAGEEPPVLRNRKEPIFDEPVSDYGTSGYDPISMEVTVEKGVTYYVAVPVYCAVANDFGDIENAISSDYNLTLTFTPDEQPAEAPSEEPAQAPETTPSDAVASTPAAPAGNPAPDDAPVVASSNFSIGDFVERLYTVALGRSSDPAGKQDWIDAITLRGQTGADAARGFLYSPEFLGKQSTNEEFVATLYRTFFDREPDEAGFEAWVEVLNNGGAKEDVIEGFINSTEWANLCILYGVRNGGTGVPNIQVEPNQQTIDFATRLYTTCLGRDADQNGLMAWAIQLSNQRDTGTEAARGFFFSSEFIGQNVSNDEYVNRLYRTFMDRDADEAGFNAWVAQLNNGASREEVFEGFAQSPEFARICASYGIVR